VTGAPGFGGGEGGGGEEKKKKKCGVDRQACPARPGTSEAPSDVLVIGAIPPSFTPQANLWPGLDKQPLSKKRQRCLPPPPWGRYTAA